MWDLLPDWNATVGWLILLSVAMFVGSLLLLPVVIVRLPADFFTRDELPSASWRRRHHASHLAIRVLKNVLGALLALVGLVMIFTPGQGLLALLVGVSLMDFPGKRRAQLAIVGRPGVLRAINALRRRAGRAPLEMPSRRRGAKELDDLPPARTASSDNPYEAPQRPR